MEKYKTSMYLRVSREDKNESISNQKALIEQFIKSRADLELISTKIDSGYSGKDFNRPAFKEMIEDIKSKKINCVIVKDFSRFGRNFIEVGKYIEEIFPFMNVRFISINDNYDSLTKNENDNLIIPFKNLINDIYIKDIAIKTKTQLDIKRQNGDFIGSFATYGYLKDSNNKNNLIVDEYASKIVKYIFDLKLEGVSNINIAKILNEKNILSPLEYKRSLGLNYKNGFKTKEKALWYHSTVIRILTNPIYIGILEQGKYTNFTYYRKAIKKPKDEWFICENNHQPIIDKNIFYIVQNLMNTDTRVSPKTEKINILSGVLYCNYCENNLIRKNYGNKNNKKIYYVCTSCKQVAIIEEEINSITLQHLKKHINCMINLENTIRLTIKSGNENMKYNSLIYENQLKLEQLHKYKLNLYKDYNENLLDDEEYTLFKKEVDDKINKLKEYSKEIDVKCNIIQNNINNDTNIYFEKYKNINNLSRKAVVLFIKKIYISKNNEINIKFNYEERYLYLKSVLKNIEVI